MIGNEKITVFLVLGGNDKILGNEAGDVIHGGGRRHTIQGGRGEEENH